MAKPDVYVQSDGSKLIGLTPNSDAAQTWLDENVQAEDYNWLGPTLWVEDRYAGSILEGMRNEALIIKVR